MLDVDIVGLFNDENQTTKLIPFEDLSASLPSLVSLFLIWDTNSYATSLQPPSFVVNGGKRFLVKDFEESSVFCTKEKGKWILGLVHKNNPAKFVGLTISNDGKNWEWILLDKGVS